MRAWGYNEKLAESGFDDIEGGVEGPMLKGPTPSMSLGAATMQLKNDYAPREFDDVADDEAELIDFNEGGKARYYHHAELVAAQAIREGKIGWFRCYVWALHAQGLGQRAIAELLGVSRNLVRPHMGVFRKNILERLDNED